MSVKFSIRPALPADLPEIFAIYARARDFMKETGNPNLWSDKWPPEDLVREDVHPATPTILRYKTMADSGSMYNTPPCWGIYICGLVFDWIVRQGGLDAMAERNAAKAKVLYDVLDASKLFRGIASPESRSQMNVTFTCADADKDAAFVKAATEAGFVGVKGHRSVGGMRASIYNAVPQENVEALAKFMRDYENANA